MDTIDIYMAKGLSKLGLLEEFKLHSITHHWKDVVGPVIAAHTRIIDIKPPHIIISADTSQWMQEIKMSQKRILQHINDYYKSEIITDMRLIMHRQSYVKANPQEPLDFEIKKKVNGFINRANISISNEDMENIDTLVDNAKDKKLKDAFRTLLINRRKKEIHLEKQGFHRCHRCHVLMERNTTYCVSCEYDIARAKIKRIKEYVRKYPYCKYNDCMPHVSCSFIEFATAVRELIYFYLDKIYKGSTSRNHMYMAAMLITHKRPEELTDQHVINLCHKYRSKFLSEEKQKEINALRGFNEWEDIPEEIKE